MRAGFYSTPQRQQSLAREAQRWLGTPFRYASAVPGTTGGVDCVGLCAAVHVACGACPPFEFPRLPLNWHLHQGDSGILAFFRSEGVRDRLKQLDPEDERMPGDLVAVKTQLCVHHLGIWLSDALGSHLLHVPINGTVQRWSLASRALRGRVVGLWRILEPSS